VASLLPLPPLSRDAAAALIAADELLLLSCRCGHCLRVRLPWRGGQAIADTAAPCYGYCCGCPCAAVSLPQQQLLLMLPPLMLLLLLPMPLLALLAILLLPLQLAFGRPRPKA
jgi:hypothetical protein